MPLKARWLGCSCADSFEREPPALKASIVLEGLYSLLFCCSFITLPSNPSTGNETELPACPFLFEIVSRLQSCLSVDVYSNVKLQPNTTIQTRTVSVFAVAAPCSPMVHSNGGKVLHAPVPALLHVHCLSTQQSSDCGCCNTGIRSRPIVLARYCQHTQDCACSSLRVPVLYFKHAVGCQICKAQTRS